MRPHSLRAGELDTKGRRIAAYPCSQALGHARRDFKRGASEKRFSIDGVGISQGWFAPCPVLLVDEASLQNTIDGFRHKTPMPSAIDNRQAAQEDRQRLPIVDGGRRL